MSSAHPTKSTLFKLGAAYYPDYVAEASLTRLTTGEIKTLGKTERIREDFARMTTQGIHCIRMGEFSWSSVEPEPGHFQFDFFKLALDLAKEHGIDVIFCTPTATPPKWLIDKYPDILPSTRDGRRIPFGSRRHYDASHPEYQRESRRITEVFAKEFGNHPAVIGWQTDNEFGCHNSVFVFTPAARTAFHTWLRQKYNHDITRLNTEWFTCFWSQGYRSFEEIELPFASWADQNPHLELDFRRFSNDMVVSFHKQQCEIIRQHSPGRFITHNLMTLFTDLCPWKLGAELDVAGFDHYQMEPEPHPVSSAWQFSLMRSLKPHQKFLVLEQQPLQVNWQAVNRRFSYDWLFLWGVQAASLGASGMLYFSWQRMYGGAEQYHDGMVPHDVRIPRSPQEKMVTAKNTFFAELAKLFALKEIPDVAPDVLCIYNSESLWSHEITSQSTAYSTRDQVDTVTEMCLSAGLGLHFAPSVEAARAQLENYGCVVLPGYAFELAAEEKAALKTYIEQGGRVVSFPRTAMKRKNNQMSALPLALFNDNDFYFEDYGAQLGSEHETVATLTDGKTKEFQTRIWSEKIKVVNDAWAPLAKFTDGLYKGSPAVIQNRFGEKGGSYTHVAFCPERTGAFSKWLLDVINLKGKAHADFTPGIQIIPLRLPQSTLLAAVNFSHTTETLRVRAAADTPYKLLKAAVDSHVELHMDVEEGTASGKLKISIPARHVIFVEHTPENPHK